MSSKALHILDPLSLSSSLPLYQKPLCISWRAHCIPSTAQYRALHSQLWPLPDQKSTVYPRSTGFVSKSLFTAVNGTYQSSKASQSSLQLFILKPADTRSSTDLKIGDAPINDLLEIIHSDHFEINLFKMTFNYANGGQDMVQRKEEKSVIGNKVQICNS